MYEYLNHLKLERAKVEAATTGGDVHDIYLRLGGKAVAIEEKEPVEAEAPKKAKKK